MGKINGLRVAGAVIGSILFIAHAVLRLIGLTFVINYADYWLFAEAGFVLIFAVLSLIHTASSQKCGYRGNGLLGLLLSEFLIICIYTQNDQQLFALYGIYIAIALVVIAFVIFIFTLKNRGTETVASTEVQSEQPTAVVADLSVNSDASTVVFEDAEESQVASVPLSAVKQDVTTFFESDTETESIDERLDKTLKTVRTPGTGEKPKKIVERESRVFSEDTLDRDMQRLNALMDEDIDPEEVEFTGEQSDDTLDIDNEFIVDSPDEISELDNKQEDDSRSEPQNPQTEASEDDTDELIGKINSLIDMISKYEDKK